MRFTVRELLALIAFACPILAFTRLPFLTGCGLLILGIVVANFLVPIRIWRFVVYGGIVGIIAGSVALKVYLNLRFGIGPPTYARTGAGIRSVTYVFQIGALVGGVLGFAIQKVRARTAFRPASGPSNPETRSDRPAA